MVINGEHVGMRRMMIGCVAGSMPNPFSIGSCVIWLDASAITGLANGDAVASWADLSGNGNTFTQSDAGRKPTYQTNIFGSKPAVLFGDKYMQRAVSISQPFTVVCMMKKGDNKVSENLYRGDTAAGAVAYAEGGIYKSYAGSVISSGVTLSNGTKYITQEVYNGASSAIGVDSSLTSGNVGTDGIATPMNLGCGTGIASMFYGHVAEFVVFSKALSTVELSMMQSYFAAKWL